MTKAFFFILVSIFSTSCNRNSSNKSEINMDKHEFYKSTLTLLSEGKVDEAIPYFADDIKLNLYGFKNINGKKEASKFFKEIPWEKHRFIVKNYIIDGNTVAVEGISITLDENNNTSESFYCDVYRFEDSKIKELSSYFVYITPNPE